ncbi:hypothetical protein OIU84_021007 [Salix udensis]|uniref:Uncharacterized protein n=1 Tax=Salix udensis TaxID=889485 RepID=A0AAD6PGZ3_9ROSI|nr:hypothetical protein OIU84_021007 [Salix udensis]
MSKGGRRSIGLGERYGKYEGAVKEDGRGPSVWDKFSHTFGNTSSPTTESTSGQGHSMISMCIFNSQGKITDFSNADVAVDQFHLFDVHGTGKINQAGVDHYNKFINALLAQGKPLHQIILGKKYKAKQQGSLGISLDVMWFEPATNSTNDIEAAQRAQDFLYLGI